MPITVACEAAFAEAAEVGGESDSIEDLYPAALACTRMDEWATGSGLYPAALDGADPLVFAQVMCRHAPREVSAASLCEQADAG